MTDAAADRMTDLPDLVRRLREIAGNDSLVFVTDRISLRDAADLIGSQHAEIERLREMHDIDSKTIEILMARCSDDDREIARLRAVEKAARAISETVTTYESLFADLSIPAGIAARTADKALEVMLAQNAALRAALREKGAEK